MKNAKKAGGEALSPYLIRVYVHPPKKTEKGLAFVWKVCILEEQNTANAVKEIFGPDLITGAHAFHLEEKEKWNLFLTFIPLFGILRS